MPKSLRTTDAIASCLNGLSRFHMPAQICSEKTDWAVVPRQVCCDTQTAQKVWRDICEGVAAALSGKTFPCNRHNAQIWDCAEVLFNFTFPTPVFRTGILCWKLPQFRNFSRSCLLSEDCFKWLRAVLVRMPSILHSFFQVVEYLLAVGSVVCGCGHHGPGNLWVGLAQCHSGWALWTRFSYVFPS